MTVLKYSFKLKDATTLSHLMLQRTRLFILSSNWGVEMSNGIFQCDLNVGCRVKQDRQGSEEVPDARVREGMPVTWDQLDHQDSRSGRTLVGISFLKLGQ